MARSFRTKLHIRVPPAAITDAFEAFDEWTSWMPGLIHVVPSDDAPFGEGTEWVETRRMFGREASETFLVTAYEPGRCLELYVDGSKGSSHRGEYRFTYDLKPSASGTDVVLAGSIDMPGLMFKILGRVLQGSLHKACARDLASLKHFLERKAT